MPNTPHAWTPKELEILGTAPDQEIADALGVSRATVWRKRSALGIRATQPRTDMPTILIGKVLGELTVLHGRRETIDGSRRSFARTYWTCRCTCGYVGEFIERNLLTGATRSCGHGKFGMPAARMKAWDRQEKEETPA